MAVGSIYAIRLKTTGRAVYVGQTKRDYVKRFREHALGRTPISKALAMFGDDAFTVELLEEFDAARLADREDHWIAELRTAHPDGLNMMGAQMSSARSAATRARMSEASKRRWSDPEYRARVLATLRAPNPGKSAKQSAALRGKAKNLSERGREVVRANIAYAHAAMADPEVRARAAAKARAKAKGRVFSETTRAKMAEAAKRRCADPAWRAKASAAQTLRMQSAEARANLSRATKRQFDSAEARVVWAERTKAQWQDSDFRAKQMASRTQEGAHGIA